MRFFNLRLLIFEIFYDRSSYKIILLEPEPLKKWLKSKLKNKKARNRGKKQEYLCNVFAYMMSYILVYSGATVVFHSSLGNCDIWK